MTSFSYRAVHTQSGAIEKGTLYAENENDLISILARKELELIDVQKKKNRTIYYKDKQKEEDQKLLFIFQMEDLLHAGLNLPECLALILKNMENSTTKDKLTNLESAVRAGTSVAESAGKESNWFDSVSLSILRAGEQSGKMAEAFSRLGIYFKKQKEFRETLLRTIRYPLFLLAISLCVTSFMMLWVVPQVTDFLLNQGRELPLATRLLISGTQICQVLWWALPLCLALISLASFIARRTSPKAIRTTDRWLLKTPYLGAILQKLAIARMMESLALLLQANLELTHAFKISIASLHNSHLMALATQAYKRIIEGNSFSQSLAPFLSPFLVQRLQIGEQSSQLPKTIAAIATNLEQEARRSLASFLAALEPALTILVGALMLWVVLAVLGPLYGSLGVIAGGV
ncbi:MAG: type II secretion system F family protein [Bdellovibrionales bacterium]